MSIVTASAPHPYGCQCQQCFDKTFRQCGDPFKHIPLKDLLPTAPPPNPNLPHAKATFDRAHSLIGGDRRDAYGDVQTSFERVAKVWSGILGNRTVTAREVCLMMAGLKLCREANSARQDNIDDACGYLGLLAELNATDGLKASKEMQY